MAIIRPVSLTESVATIVKARLSWRCGHLDPEAVAYAQQMMEDNQFFAVVKEKMKDRGLNSTYTLLRLPGEYDLIMKQPRREGRLPMSDGMPDVLFSDEEVGVVALKNGDEILYTSLYWRANFA